MPFGAIKATYLPSTEKYSDTPIITTNKPRKTNSASASARFAWMDFKLWRDVVIGCIQKCPAALRRRSSKRSSPGAVDNACILLPGPFRSNATASHKLFGMLSYCLDAKAILEHSQSVKHGNARRNCGEMTITSGNRSNAAARLFYGKHV